MHVINRLWHEFQARDAVLLFQLSVQRVGALVQSDMNLHGVLGSCQAVTGVSVSARASVGELAFPVMSVAKHVDLTLAALSSPSCAAMHKYTTCLCFHLHAVLSGSERSGNMTPNKHPDTLLSRKKLMPAYFAVSACLAMLTICWQLRSGQRRYKRACHALRILPPSVAMSLIACAAHNANVGSRSVIQQFLSQQLGLQHRLPVAGCEGGSLYALLCKNTYVGVSACQHHACWGRDPLRRFVEHLHAPPLLLRKDPPSTVGYVWLHDVDSKQALFLVESCHISKCQPTSNRTYKLEVDLRLPGRRRKRPHKRLRSRRAAYLAGSQVLDNRVCLHEALIKKHAHRRWPPQPASTTVEHDLGAGLRLPWLLLYQLVQRVQCVSRGLQATVLHYACSMLLLTQWLCSKGSGLDWHVVYGLWGPGIAYRLANCVRVHPRPKYKKRGWGRLAKHMKAMSELPLRVVVLKLPPFVKSAARVGRALHQVAHQLSRGVAERWFWLKSHLRLVVTPRRHLRATRFNMQRVMKDARWCMYEALSCSELQALLAGTSMKRVKLWAKFPDVTRVTSEWHDFKQQVRDSCRTLRLSTDESICFENTLFRSVWREQKFELIRPPLEQYAWEVPSPDINTCLVQEDKDVAACWVMPRAVYQVRMFHLLSQDARWLATSLTIQEASSLRAAVINETLLSAGRILRASPDPNHLPYGYGTVKAKCFQGSLSDGWRHTCCKPLHSCFRKIVSWGSCEANVRALFRHASRATTLLVAKYCLGWETLSLKNSVADLKSRLCKLDLSCACCPGCGAERDSRISLLVADAGQMFEQIDPKDVIKNLRSVIECAQVAGYQAVVLKRGKRLRGSLCRSEHVAVHNADVWVFSDLLALVELSLHDALKHVRWGDRVLRQAKGSPIGGLMSRLHAMLALGPAENAVVCHSDALLASQLAAVRYVDDLLLVSTRCLDCVRSLVQRIYPEYIKFDVEQASYTNVHWLDVSVTVAEHGVVVDAWLAEEAWLYGRSLFPERQRWPPFLHHSCFSPSDFKQRVKALVARWSQMGLSKSQLQAPVAHLMAVLAKLDYPQNLVIKGLCRHGGPLVAFWVKYWRDTLSLPHFSHSTRTVKFRW